jgi:hypothetical protein
VSVSDTIKYSIIQINNHNLNIVTLGYRAVTTTLRSSLIPMYSFTLSAILLPYMDIINFRIPFSLAPEMFYEADETVMKS